MKKLLAVFSVVLLLAFSLSDADAAMRFGGGRSFGRSTGSLFQKAPTPSPSFSNKATKPAPGATKQAQGAQQSAKVGSSATAAATARPAGGMLMGMAAALGLTALVSMLGVSAGFAQVLMVLILAMLAFYALRFVMSLMTGKHLQRDTSENRQGMGTQADFAQEQCRPGSVMDSFSQGELEGLSVPAGFDAKGFESVARENFIKLQKAWDEGKIVSVADFMTEDFFIALTHQFRAHGAVAQTSDIVNLSTKLLGIVRKGSEYVAVVSFEGAMTINGQFEEVHERWLLVQAEDGSTGWLLAGIEQV